MGEFPQTIQTASIMGTLMVVLTHTPILSRKKRRREGERRRRDRRRKRKVGKEKEGGKKERRKVSRQNFTGYI